ncbi:hypothetical protein GCM10010837_01720 [Aminobacter niigataensis]
MQICAQPCASEGPILAAQARAALTICPMETNGLRPPPKALRQTLDELVLTFQLRRALALRRCPSLPVLKPNTGTNSELDRFCRQRLNEKCSVRCYAFCVWSIQ